jgi:hypothetical protein
MSTGGRGRSRSTISAPTRPSATRSCARPSPGAPQSIRHCFTSRRKACRSAASARRGSAPITASSGFRPSRTARAFCCRAVSTPHASCIRRSVGNAPSGVHSRPRSPQKPWQNVYTRPCPSAHVLVRILDTCWTPTEIPAVRRCSPPQGCKFWLDTCWTPVGHRPVTYRPKDARTWLAQLLTRT